MKISNIERQKNGGHTFSVEATPVETAVLINIALDTLLNVGKIANEDYNKEEFEVDLTKLPPEAFFHG